MKRIFFAIASFLIMSLWTGMLTSCSDTETYADLVDAEKSYISSFCSFADITAETVDEDWLDEVTDAVVTRKEDPADYIELGKWYAISEGDFKRLYFKIKSWGNRQEEDLEDGKFTTGSNVLVRYDSCYNLGTFENFETGKGSNLEPNNYEIIYSWNSAYYASTYYGTYYGTGSAYECTSGGLGFPVRFLWNGGEAALIVPFSLSSTAEQSYYLTCYYGSVKYTRPNYLPE